MMLCGISVAFNSLGDVLGLVSCQCDSEQWQVLMGFQSTEAFGLLAIADHKALSARRRRADVELDEEMAAAIPNPADDPELVMQKKHLRGLIRRALSKLTPEHSEILDLVYY